MSQEVATESNLSDGAPSTSPKKRGIPPLVAIFITVLIDLLGFAMFIPDLQLRGQQISRAALGASASAQSVEALVGITIAIFSIAQLITSPWMGRLSDQKGRRVVLLLSSALSICSYLLYSHATTVPLLLLSRALSGIAAANLGVAFAYVADTSEPKDRAKSLGMLGAAFGLGFILGPALGAWLLKAGHDSPLLLGYVSTALVSINFLFIYFFVPESLKPENRSSDTSFFKNLKTAFATPGLGLMLMMFFAINLGFTNLETTYFRLLAAPNWIFHFSDPKTDGAYVLVCVGIVGAIMQGGVVRKVIPAFGELNTMKYSYLLFAPVLALIPFAPLWFPGIIVIILLGVSNGLAGPSLNALISKASPRQMQGSIFGILQALGALARATSPLISSPLFAWRPYAPYLLGGAIALVPTICAWVLLKPIPDTDVLDTDSEPVVAH